MGAGWFVVMNVLQPRIMQGAVGIHPIVVLGSVLIGAPDRGHPGRDLRHPDRGGRVGLLLPVPAPELRAIGRSPGAPPAGSRSVTGRPVRVPREPTPGSAADIDDGPGAPTSALAPSDPEPGTRARQREPTTALPDMTRERARTERRDLDKERGEPLAGGAGRGGPRALRDARPAARRMDDAGRGSW